MQKNKLAQVFCLIVLLTGCGGGGDDKGQTVNNDSGSSGKTEFVKPVYNGKLSL